MSTEPQIQKWDVVTLVIYFGILFVVFFFSIYKRNRSTLSGYFLANREMNWFLIGMSLFSTNIGAEHFLGLAGSGAAQGISAAAFEINAMAIIQLLSWVFLPVLISANAHTLPQYFSVRFGGKRIRSLLAVVYLALYIFTKVSVNIYAGAIFINLTFKWNMYIAILAVLFLTAIFTIGGGLASVMYTDTLMSGVMLIGGMCLMIISFNHIKGFKGLYTSYMNAIPDAILALNQTNSSNPLIQCGIPKEKAFVMLRGITDSYLPWLGFFLGHTPSTVWYWCSDQMMVQRVLSAKSMAHARGGTLLTGFLKLTPLFMMVFVGMISRASYINTVGCADPVTCQKVCNNKIRCTNIAYPTIAMELLPVGLKGIMMAVMVSALISGLTSLYNSSSTLFTLDVYRVIRSKASNKELMIVGRAFSLIVILLSIAWIPLVIELQGTEIYIYIQSINSFFAPPITCVYILAVFWKRVNEIGAFSGLVVGFVIGLVRMILEFSKREAACGEPENRLSIIANFNFMYFALLLFWVTFIVVVIVSLLTEPLPDSYSQGTTYWTKYMKHRTTKSLELEIDNQLETVNKPENLTNINANQDTKKSKVFKTQILRYLRKMLYCLCGMNETQVMQSSNTSEDDDVIAKFDENKQSKKVKIVLLLFLAVLILSEILVFVIFSLNPRYIFKSQ